MTGGEGGRVSPGKPGLRPAERDQQWTLSSGQCSVKSRSVRVKEGNPAVRQGDYGAEMREVWIAVSHALLAMTGGEGGRVSPGKPGLRCAQQ